MNKGASETLTWALSAIKRHVLPLAQNGHLPVAIGPHLMLRVTLAGGTLMQDLEGRRLALSCLQAHVTTVDAGQILAMNDAPKDVAALLTRSRCRRCGERAAQAQIVWEADQ
jgi:hypothetical protein